MAALYWRQHHAPWLSLFLAEQVILKTLMADPGNRHYFGLNRPEQTGEADAHGFRTSSHADTVPALPTLDPTGTRRDTSIHRMPHLFARCS